MHFVCRENIKEKLLTIDELNAASNELKKIIGKEIPEKKSKDFKKNLKKLNKFYNSENVKKHLVLCYGRKCCYCESLIPSTSYFHVDHFYPKSPSNGLPKQFRNKFRYAFHIVNDVRNFHLACNRCNVLKSDFVGLALSPNYYYKKGQWKCSSEDFITKNLKYKGARVESSKEFKSFIEKLYLNESTDIEKKGLHMSLLLERTRYLNKIGAILHACYALCYAKKYEDAKNLFDSLSSCFGKRAHFSRMIVINYGKAFLKIKKFLELH